MLISFYFNRHAFLLQPPPQEKDRFFHDFCDFFLDFTDKYDDQITRSEMPQQHPTCQRRIQESPQDSLVDF